MGQQIHELDHIHEMLTSGIELLERHTKDPLFDDDYLGMRLAELAGDIEDIERP